MLYKGRVEKEGPVICVTSRVCKNAKGIREYIYLLQKNRTQLEAEEKNTSIFSKMEMRHYTKDSGTQTQRVEQSSCFDTFLRGETSLRLYVCLWQL